MNHQFPLPPHISIRRAIAKDHWEIRSLLLTWDDSYQTFINNFYVLIIWLIVITIIAVYNWLLALCIFAVYFLSEYQFKTYKNFWVIDADGVIVGCAELRNTRHYSLLFNVCVKRKYRYHKLGSSLVESLIHQSQKPLYLGCYKELIPFYSRIGFTVISQNKIPVEIQYSLGLNQGRKIIPMVFY